jgi:uncharacterized cupredoxin-like copper-binding protein
MRRRHALLAVAATGAMLAVAGCGSSDPPVAASGSAKSAKSASSSTATAASGGKVTVSTTEFAFAPKAITASAGKLTLTLDNKGKVPHELVVLKTSAAPDALKVTGGRVSEADSVGEVSETAGGTSKSKTLDLKPGSYVYVCNIPGHYGDGMYGTLTVK